MSNNPLVSIITPCYNSSKFIVQTIESVLAQTYQNWEMIIVDDCSKDDSIAIITDYLEKDKRIKLFTTEKNSKSPVEPRNIGIKNAKGRFIAFLDSDDIWLSTKLEQQIKLFLNKKTAIVYSNYEKINEKGERNNRIVVNPSVSSYKELLKGNIIALSTGIYDTKKVGKVYFKKIGWEDYGLWLSLLKQGYIAQNTNTVSALYRVRNFSISGNKIHSAKLTWKVYRYSEKFGILWSLYYFLHYCIRSGIKYLK